ncbi:hypothetical protein HDG34_004993 [Paraburkholderia sp. HC6.4b]|uniref:hypothetical protein n=1 Tax=unclassified Paraburkholderia TaxID=2615204 RepID=UPI00160A52F5|nr:MULTISPECIES: hypothetical protein [unclassified Paraburkholderia]MBB5411036.1 hypothetical protein [Paraburkholderia sp. HC6.4b]MBB5455152.1 hypothetical protein [Paraburkholderia sp. Kb1A]
MVMIARGESVGEAWIDGLQGMLNLQGDVGYMLVTEIGAPTIQGPHDREIARQVDAMLRRARKQPVQAVSNTLFPQDVASRFTAPLMYRHYLDEVYPLLKQERANWWGTYAHRLFERTQANGTVINPLDRMIRKMAASVRRGRVVRSHHELSLVDPDLEIAIADPTLPGMTSTRSGPCLSHLSFKVPDRTRVDLIAFYRTHYFVEKALGNFVGLARLLNFVAREAGLNAGTLTVISSCAKLDLPAGTTRADLRQLQESFSVKAN